MLRKSLSPTTEYIPGFFLIKDSALKRFEYIFISPFFFKELYIFKLLSDKLIAKDKIIQNKVDEISAIKTKISYYLKHNTSLEYVTIVLLILLIGFLVCVYIDPNNLINGIICVHNRFHGIPMYDDNEF